MKDLEQLGCVALDAVEAMDIVGGDAKPGFDLGWAIGDTLRYWTDNPTGLPRFY